jgi:hypothetical protein
MKPEYLAGWKAIAEYLGRGVRTVQRWEIEFGLPIRRPAGRAHGAVMAHREEIDQWFSSRPMDRETADVLKTSA